MHSLSMGQFFFMCYLHSFHSWCLTTALTDLFHMTHVIQDEEDQLYLMDDTGNIELSQRSHPEAPPAGGKPESSGQAGDWADVGWGDWADDDPCYLEALEEVERSAGEVSDELLLMAADEWEKGGKPKDHQWT